MPIGEVWIYRLLFVCSFVFCTVTDFSAEENASGVKFCTAVYRRKGQGISHVCELQIGRIGQRAGHLHDVHSGYRLAPEHMHAPFVNSSGVWT